MNGFSCQTPFVYGIRGSRILFAVGTGGTRPLQALVGRLGEQCLYRDTISLGLGR